MKFSKRENKTGVKRVLELERKIIPISEIKYAAYQRELKPSRVKKIVKNFIPDIMGTPIVSYRRGQFWCVDGQHTIKALEEMGYKEIECRILKDLSYEEECLRFVILNTGRTQLTANQIFHGRVEEKDYNAITLVQAFSKYGFNYNKNGSGRNTNCIGTVSSFIEIQEKYGTEMVEKILFILRKAWFGEKDSLLASIINGLKTFLNENRNVDEKILIKVLEKISPADLDHDARAAVRGNRIKQARAGSACYHVAKFIEQLYEHEITKPKRGRKSELIG